MSKAKSYYIHDKTNQLILTGLDVDEVKDIILGTFLIDKTDYNIFEYGALEERGAGLRLNEKYSVNKKFTIKENKMEFTG